MTVRTPIPLPARINALYYPCYDDGVNAYMAPTAIPYEQVNGYATVNQIYVFQLLPPPGNFNPNGTPTRNNGGKAGTPSYVGTAGRFQWEYGSRFTAAHAATLRSRGQRVVLTLGGANAGYNFETIAEANQFLYGQNTTSTTGGVAGGVCYIIENDFDGHVDGIDFNNFEANIGSSATALLHIATELKARYGNDFSIGAPPAWYEYNPNLASEDAYFIKPLVVAGKFDLVQPQIYDGGDASAYPASDLVWKSLAWLPVMRGNNPDNATNNAIAARGIMMGTGANYGLGANVANNVSAITSLIQQYPTFRGAMGWNAYTDRNANWTYSRQMANAMFPSAPSVSLPTANFTVSPASGVAGSTAFVLTNTSTNATSYAWAFGDGTSTAAASPGNKTYANPGTYTITLTATNASGSSQTSKSVTVTTAIPSPPAASGISYVGQATGTTSATLPAHVAGDLILIYAFRDGTATAPTLPGGYTQIQAPVGTSCAGILGYKLAASNAETSGTWTNATAVVAHVYRGVHQIIPIGGSTPFTGSSNVPTYSAIATMTVAEGTSWVAAFGGFRSIDGTYATAPSGMTNRSSTVDATDACVGFDTNGTVSSWSTSSYSVGGTASGWATVTVELIAAEPTGTAGTQTTTAWFAPTASSVAGTWSGAANVYASDDSRATTTVPSPGENKIWAGNFAGLLAAIPRGSSIDGIEVSFEGSAAAHADAYSYAGISSNGSFLPIRNATFQTPVVPATEGVFNIGGTTNLLGGCDTNNDNVSNRAWQRIDFGPAMYAFLAVGVNSGVTRAVSIDQIRMRVTYTPLATTAASISYNNTAFGVSQYGPPPVAQYTNNATGTTSYSPTITTRVDTGWKSAGSAVQDGGPNQWTGLSNVTLADGTPATVSIPPNLESAGLFVSGFNFNIPSNAIIRGIEFSYRTFTTSGGIGYSYSRAVNDYDTFAVRSVSEKSIIPSGVWQYQVMGSQTDTWGDADTNANGVADRLWTPADINNPHFCSYIAFGANTTGATLNVDYVQARVTYDTAQTFLSYNNTATGTNTYGGTVNQALFFSNSSAGINDYAPNYTLNRTYTNSATGSNSYTQTYTDTKTYISYTNTGSGSNVYGAIPLNLTYSNTATGTTTYNVQNSNSIGHGFGPAVGAVRLNGESTPQVSVEQPAKKVHVADKKSIKALQETMRPSAMLDPVILAQMEAMRVQLEAEAREAHRVEEEENAQIAFVVALAQRSRGRFRRFNA